MGNHAEMFRLIGHRGAAALAPENTMPSFVKAYECGATAIEFDVRLTKDGVPIIYHDSNFKRLTGFNAYVTDVSFEETKKLRVKGEAPIPTLEEVLEFASGKLAVDIELKVVGIEKETVNLLRKYGLEDKALITSFLPTVLGEIKNIAPDIEVGVLLEEWNDEYLDIARRIDAYALLPPYTIVTREMVDKIKGSGYALIVWTVNDPREAEKLLEMGVDGIITDDPCKLREVVR